MWTLCDDSCYGSTKGLLSALHKNPIEASGGERNHKAGKCVHSRSCAWLGQVKIKIGTTILFNAKQLIEEALDEEEDAASGCIEEFDRLDISDGIDSIVDKDLFDEEVVDKGNIFN